MSRIDPRAAQAARLNGAAFRSLRFGGVGFSDALAALLESDAPIDRKVRDKLAAAIRKDQITFTAITARQKADAAFLKRALGKYTVWLDHEAKQARTNVSWDKYWDANPDEKSKDEIVKFAAKLRKYRESGLAEGITYRGTPLSKHGLSDQSWIGGPAMVQDFCMAYFAAEQAHEKSRRSTA